MTINQAINEVDNLKPNMYGLPEKIKWLSRLDRRIFEQILMTHEPDEDRTFAEYTEEDLDRELIVGEPYDEMYVFWLAAQIDQNNMEYVSFNNTNALFESVYSAFRNAFNRTHMPKGRRKIYF